MQDEANGLLKGKTAIVTGAARGIGLAVTGAYLAQGANVVMADVLADELEAAAAKLQAPDRIMTAVLDVTDEAGTEQLAEAAASRFGSVDIVVPNAGILVLKHAVDIELAEWRRVVDINLTGAFITAKIFGRRLIGQGTGGRIIFTSSLFGLRGGKENAAYSAAKFGMIGLAQSMAAELAGHGILVNSVCPGQMETDMIAKLFADRAALTGTTAAAVRGALEGRIPVGHLGTMDELAGTYVWLASHLSRYVTGQSITVDGGWQVG